MKRKVKEMTGEMKKIQQDMETLQGSFMDIGNVTMVSVFVENSQIQKAVDLQRHMNCEMQLNFAACRQATHHTCSVLNRTVRAVDIGS